MSCAFSGIFVQVRLEMVFAGWEQYCHLFCLFRMQLFLVFFLRKYMCSVIAACKTSWQHAPEYKSTGASRGRQSSLRLFRKGCVLSGYSLWLYILTWSLAPYREWVFLRVLEDMWPHPAAQWDTRAYCSPFTSAVSSDAGSFLWPPISSPAKGSPWPWAHWVTPGTSSCAFRH